MPRRPEQTPGTDLIERVQEILRRCEATWEQVNFPGEGGERRFRLWLATEFFSDLLDWPGTSVVQGERFDLILRDDDGLPVITIETKTPYLTKLARLGGYLARSSDPPPGNMVVWRGLSRLTDIHLGFLLANHDVGNRKNTRTITHEATLKRSQDAASPRISFAHD